MRDRPAEAVGLSSETRFRLAAGDPVVTDDLVEEEELTRLQAVEVRMSLEEENVSETAVLRRPPFDVIITPYGKRYHVNTRCCTLRNSSRRVLSMWCASCSMRTIEAADAVPYSKAWCRGPGALAHLDRECVSLEGDAGEFQLCMRCSLDE